MLLVSRLRRERALRLLKVPAWMWEMLFRLMDSWLRLQYETRRIQRFCETRDVCCRSGSQGGQLYCGLGQSSKQNGQDGAEDRGQDGQERKRNGARVNIETAGKDGARELGPN